MGKRKQLFFPPVQIIDPPNEEAINAFLNMTKKERKQFERSDAYKKYVQPVLEREKEQKRTQRKEWWKNNWIALLSLIFAFIAAIPVIIQGIASILELLG